MAIAVGQRTGAIEGLAGRVLEDVELVRPRVTLRHGEAHVDEQGAERLANLVMDVAGEPLTLAGDLPLAAPFRRSLVLQTARHPHDVSDPTRHQLQDGDPFRG